MPIWKSRIEIFKFHIAIQYKGYQFVSTDDGIFCGGHNIVQKTFSKSWYKETTINISLRDRGNYLN